MNKNTGLVSDMGRSMKVNRWFLACSILMLAAVPSNSGTIDSIKKYFNFQNEKQNDQAADSTSPLNGSTTLLNIYKYAKDLPVTKESIVSLEFEDLPTKSTIEEKISFSKNFNFDLATAKNLNSNLSVFANNSVLLCMTSAGLKIFDKSRGEWGVSTKLTEQQVRPQEAVVDDNDSSLWLDGDGLYSYDTASNSIISYTIDAPNDVIKKIISSPPYLWIATTHDLLLFDRKKKVFRRAKNFTLFSNGVVNGISRDNEILFLTSDNKLVQIFPFKTPNPEFTSIDLSAYGPTADLVSFGKKIWLTLAQVKPAGYVKGEYASIPVLASLDPTKAELKYFDFGNEGIQTVYSWKDRGFIKTTKGQYSFDSNGEMTRETLFPTGTSRSHGKNIFWIGGSYDFSGGTGFVVRYVLDPSKYPNQNGVKAVLFKGYGSYDTKSVMPGGESLWLISSNRLIRYDLKSEKAWEYYSTPKIHPYGATIFSDLYRGHPLPYPPEYQFGSHEAYDVTKFDPMRPDMNSNQNLWHIAEDMADKWGGIGVHFKEIQRPNNNNGEEQQAETTPPEEQIAHGLWHFKEGSSWEQVPLQNGLTSDYVTALSLNKHHVGIGTDKGAFLLNRKTGKCGQVSKSYVFNIAHNSEYVFSYEGSENIIGYPLGKGKKMSISLRDISNKINLPSLKDGAPIMLANSLGLLVGNQFYDIKNSKWHDLEINLSDHSLAPDGETIVAVSGSWESLRKLQNKNGKFEMEEMNIPVTFVEKELEGTTESGQSGEEAISFNLFEDSSN